MPRIIYFCKGVLTGNLGKALSAYGGDLTVMMDVQGKVVRAGYKNINIGTSSLAIVDGKIVQQFRPFAYGAVRLESGAAAQCTAVGWDGVGWGETG